MQFIIAGIILGNPYISLTSMFIYIWAVVTYNINALNIFKNSPVIQALIGAVIVLGGSFISLAWRHYCVCRRFYLVYIFNFRKY